MMSRLGAAIVVGAVLGCGTATAECLKAEKPDQIAEGKLTSSRFTTEAYRLTEQAYIMDDKMKVAQAVEKAAKDIGAPVKLVGYVRFGLGEGIQKEEKDFAAEVAAVVGR